MQLEGQPASTPRQVAGWLAGAWLCTPVSYLHALCAGPSHHTTPQAITPPACTQHPPPQSAPASRLCRGSAGRRWRTATAAAPAAWPACAPLPRLRGQVCQPRCGWVSDGRELSSDQDLCQQREHRNRCGGRRAASQRRRPSRGGARRAGPSLSSLERRFGVSAAPEQGRKQRGQAGPRRDSQQPAHSTANRMQAAATVSSIALGRLLGAEARRSGGSALGREEEVKLRAWSNTNEVIKGTNDPHATHKQLTAQALCTGGAWAVGSPCAPPLAHIASHTAVTVHRQQQADAMSPTALCRQATLASRHAGSPAVP